MPMGQAPLDIAGHTFGSWTALSYVASSGGYWRCRCTCGHQSEVRSNALRKGRSTKCPSCANRIRARRVFEARFWGKTDRTGSCWLWLGTRDKDGYGKYGARSITNEILAHRIAWTLTRGEIPSDMLVCHSCDNPPCINPEHLFLGSPLDNTRDMDKKGRRKSHGPRGERAWTSKLNAASVLEIRQKRADGALLTALAHEYNVTTQTIWQITSGRAWTHVTTPMCQRTPGARSARPRTP
jgi:hypothetical protein